MSIYAYKSEYSFLPATLKEKLRLEKLKTIILKAGIARLFSRPKKFVNRNNTIDFIFTRPHRALRLISIGERHGFLDLDQESPVGYIFVRSGGKVSH